MVAERKGETEADRQQKPGLEWFMERSLNDRLPKPLPKTRVFQPSA